MMILRLLLLVGSMLILACGDKSDGNTIDSGLGGVDQPASPEALKELPVSNLELDEIIEALRDIEVQHPQSTASSYGLAKKDYLFCEGEEKTTDTVELTGDRIDVTYEANAQSCLAETMPTNAALSNERGTAKFKFSMSCEAEGIEVITENKASAFFEGTDDVVGGDIICSSAEGIEGLYYTNVEFDLGITAAANNKTVSVSTYSGYSTANEDGEPCTFTVMADTKIAYSDCTYSNFTYTKTDASDDTKDKAEATKLSAKFTGLSARLGGKYFREGTVEVELNNWTGAFKFANASTAPIGTLTDGTTEYKIKLDGDFTKEATEDEIEKWYEPLSFDKESELHVVSVYEADTTSITVNYNRSEKGVLVLSSNNKVEWVIAGNVDKVVGVVVSQSNDLSTVTGVSEDKVNNIGKVSNPSSESNPYVESYTWEIEDITNLDKTTLFMEYKPSSVDID